MAWKSWYLDATLVPAGLALLTAYHIRLAYRVHTKPHTTIIGVNHTNRRAWVQNIMADSRGNGVLGIQTIRNSIMAATLLASTAITLSSLIAALVSGTSTKASSSFILGSHLPTVLTVKYLSILVCFLVAFVCNVQAIRYSSHVGFLLTVPMGDSAPGLTPEYVNRLLHRSTNFFSFGLRAYYFSFPLLLWLFGPILHFVCSVVLVFLLNIVDTANEFKLNFPDPHFDKMFETQEHGRAPHDNDRNDSITKSEKCSV